ncbi:periplasmic heavy metal sensor [Trinickia symbiotica]|uniref:periplasmic heavy metal sensor n=1 Tax=Trinickia symbiotica TaxID=863227 RepID=UPI0015E710F9|nr:periplasmic heavy metal sensor [Trinickia symbiotica]
MNPIFRTTARYLAVASAALAVTFGAAYAAGDGMSADGAGMHGWQRGGMMHQLEALHTQLHLTPEQEQKWQSALATMKQNHEAMHASHEKMRQQFKAAEQQPILDLDALHAAHQQAEQQNAQLREQTETAWLAFYDSLNDQQKTTVSTELKRHFARMEARHEKMREGWEKHHDGAAASSPSTSQ